MILNNSVPGVKMKKSSAVSEVPGVRVKKGGTIITVWEKVRECIVSRHVANTDSWPCSCGGTIHHTHYTGAHSACGSSETFSYKISVCDTCGKTETEGTDWTAHTHEY